MWKLLTDSTNKTEDVSSYPGGHADSKTPPTKPLEKYGSAAPAAAALAAAV